MRTVIRWEKELGLPVHRYPGKAKGRVYAHVSELKDWAQGPRRAAAEADKASESMIDRTEVDGDANAPEFAEIPNRDIDSHLATRRRAVWISAAVGMVIAVALVSYAAWRLRNPKPIGSVAVPPFDNLGNESDPALVEGLTDEIASSLSRLDGVRVVGRRSAYTFRGKWIDLGKIASALDVEAVVEGSVQRSEDHTRVAVQLNRTRNGFTIWAQTFDSNSGDWFQNESEIASAVARALSRDSLPVNVVARSTSNPEARALYVQGRYLWNQRNLDAEQKSVEYMRRAIASDPNYAQAWSGLADSLVTIGNLENVRPSDYIPQARDTARKALELDPNLAEAHAVLGRIAAHYDYDWATAENEYNKAIRLNPSYATAHQYYALGLMAHGRLAEAKRQLDLASQLDPLALIVGVDKALLCKFQRDYEGIIRESKRVLQLDPNYQTGYSMLATGYYLLHRWDEWRQIDAKYPQFRFRERWQAAIPRKRVNF